MSSVVSGDGTWLEGVVIWMRMATVVGPPKRFGVKVTWSLADCEACAMVGTQAQATSPATSMRAWRAVRPLRGGLIRESSSCFYDHCVGATVEGPRQPGASMGVGVATSAAGDRDRAA